MNGQKVSPLNCLSVKIKRGRNERRRLASAWLVLVVVRDGAANNDRSDYLLSETLPIVALPH